MPPVPRKSSTNRRRYPRQPGPPDPRSMELQLRCITTHLLKGATPSVGSETSVLGFVSKNSYYEEDQLGSMPHQSTLHSSNESLQNTQHITVQEPHPSSSNSMPTVEPIVADRQHVPLADSELSENTTAGFEQTSSHTWRHAFDSIVAPYLPSISSRFPPQPSAVHSQPSIASPHVGPHQPKATLQLPTAAPAVSQCPTTNQLQTNSQSAVLTGSVLPQIGNLEDVSAASRSSQPTGSLSESVPSPPMPLHLDIPDNLLTCLNSNHILTTRAVTTSPTLTHPEINRSEVPGGSTSPPASILFSPVPSHSCASAPKHLHGLNSNYDYGPPSSPPDTSPMLLSNPEMPPRFRSFHPQHTTYPLTTNPDSPPQPQEIPIADTPVRNRQTVVRKERLFPDGSGSTIWYQTSSDEPLSSPPMIAGSEDGDVFLHQHQAGAQVWVMSSRQWVMATEGHIHPLLPQRRLGVRLSGEPSWLTLRSYNVRKSKRKVRAKGPATITTVIEM